MAAEMRNRPVEGFDLGIKSHIRLKAEKIRPKKPEKVDQEKMYPIEELFVREHFNDFDEWRDGDDLVDKDKSSLGRFVPRFIPSEDSLSDRASALFNRLGREIKFSLFSTKRESPEVRIEMQIDMDIYKTYLQNIGFVKKSRGWEVHCIDDNSHLCDLLDSKWFERIQNENGDFCYVIPVTVRFWLHERKPVREFVYVGDTLVESHTESDLQVIFTFVHGDGVKAEYNSNEWKSPPS
ncbi:hypothetical protein AWC38_SpisGene6305 [Stylophora pistillata]|uniref:Uncharacterized protein n=1 Tax=Stylophora pistillata TaxID=50429 RepID=A0A2B4SK80_STYPI|nr:hypothetical protein AWC38_SpisGene6305 [Stylophora pistillata]